MSRLRYDLDASKCVARKRSYQQQERTAALEWDIKCLIEHIKGLEHKLREADREAEAAKVAAAEARAECACKQDTINSLRQDLDLILDKAVAADADMAALQDKHKCDEARWERMLQNLKTQCDQLMAQQKAEQDIRKWHERKATKLMAELQATQQQVERVETEKAARASSDTCTSARSSQPAENGHGTADGTGDDNTMPTTAAAPPADWASNSSLASERASSDDDGDDEGVGTAAGPYCMCGQQHCATCSTRAANIAGLSVVGDELVRACLASYDVSCISSCDGDSNSGEDDMDGAYPEWGSARSGDADSKTPAPRIWSSTPAGPQRFKVDVEEALRLNGFADSYKQNSRTACFTQVLIGVGCTDVTSSQLLEVQQRVDEVISDHNHMSQEGVEAVARAAAGAATERAAALSSFLLGCADSVADQWRSEALVAVCAVYAVGGPLLQPADMQAVLQGVKLVQQSCNVGEGKPHQMAGLLGSLRQLGKVMLA